MMSFTFKWPNIFARRRYKPRGSLRSDAANIASDWNRAFAEIDEMMASAAAVNTAKTSRLTSAQIAAALDDVITLGVIQERQRRYWARANATRARADIEAATAVDVELDQFIRAISDRTIAVARQTGAIDEAIAKAIDKDNILW